MFPGSNRVDASEKPARRPSLLVVDDDDAIRESLQCLFAGLDYEVRTAKDGAEALEKLAAQRADLVLTDIYMAAGDGYELISILRKKHRQTLVAVMSGGHPAYDALAFANRLGADLVLQKPFRNAQLIESVDRLIRSYRRLPE
jgi:CheY-like chemotaxis protein